MVPIYLTFRKWIALLVAAAVVVISSTGAGAFANPSQSLSNPSEIQYGYDPIVGPGGSQSGQTGSSGSSEPVTPGERVAEASAIVAAIADGTGGNGANGSVGESGIQTNGVGGSLAGNEASGESSDFRSFSFIAILLALSVGLAAWAVARRRSSGGSGTAEMAIRAASFVFFLALIVLLNGSAESILG